MIDLPLDELRHGFGFGVAGNFAGHLEQAGEAADFVHVEAAAEAPKGIFPWYVPAAAEGAVPAFLHAFPLAHDAIAKPPSSEPVNLQIEPEVGLLAAVRYGDDGAVTALQPQAIAAFNDCSIRRPGARKISEKKNWGADSKGVAARGFAIDDLAPDGPTASFRLASFLRRDGRSDGYGIDSPLPEYSYYGARLLDWIVERLAHQEGADGTPLEPVGAYLRAARPERVLIGIGATRYTPFGESTFLRDGDDAIVIVYDGAVHAPEQVAEAVAGGREDELTAASVLRQRVRDAN
ncbi:DUF5718 family protein [Patulibacter defluvii]|uniref:DUF5718 family protein n=1 Tax=Patulibacter defluvii TaxID=3095358 RepID=UPI002A7498D1|nr:DUF5718 family protein [Patulibacter sp. DM4]